MNQYKIININLTSVISEEPITKVPCNGCTRCCETLTPFLTPEEISSGLYPISLINPTEEHVKQNPNIGPMVTMFKNKNGGCGMFVDNKCSIYEIRPLSCRQFDCRKSHHPAMIEFVKEYFDNEKI